MLWRPRPCFAASPWTALYSWFYIPGSIFLVLYSWLCIPGFIFQVSYYWFYIPSFIFQDWECFGGLGLASRPRLGLLYIPGFIFLVLYSWFYIPGFVFLAFRFQISDSRIQIFILFFTLSLDHSTIVREPSSTGITAISHQRRQGAQHASFCLPLVI